MRIAAACLALLLPGSATAETCRLALALALDVSGSVDQTEYRLQAEGLAAALTDPEVEAALFTYPAAPVAIAVYEWSASRYQRLLQDWILVRDAATLREVAEHGTDFMYRGPWADRAVAAVQADGARLHAASASSS